MEKEIVILAKSSKRGGYCIAGVDATTGEWIRPISQNVDGEGAVPLEDIKYEDRTQVEILDIVTINFLSHKPSKSQPENYIYNPQLYWAKTGTSSLTELLTSRGYDNPKEIFYNYSRSVSESEINGQPSLLLVNVKNPTIGIKTSQYGRKVKLNFLYNNMWYYDFSVSDNTIKNLYSNHVDGFYSCGSNLPVVFSLTDVFRGDYYKMAAQIFINS